jgi:tetratricopeptide (TPR) repeat protein
MSKTIWILMLACWLPLGGCGPDTIFMRPGLDTPAQHVHNGHQLLKTGRVDDAYREFNRARELDPNFIKAYVGLGLALGHKGDLEAGLQNMDLASQMANSESDRRIVKDGYDQLRAMHPATDQ